MNKKISILEFPSNLGLKGQQPGHEPGVRKLPDWLRQHHFHQLINPSKIHHLPPPLYGMEIDPGSGVRNATAIAVYAQQQAELVRETMAQGNFILALGGDCSVLVGNTLALKQTGNFALFFLDGHTDFAWSSMSASKGAAGMDLAIVTGHAHEKLSNIDSLAPYIQEENVWSVGNRDFDEVYVRTILQSGIHYFDLNKLREMGIDQCCRQFLEMIDEKKLDGFWIHLDVDVLDDEIMPAVDSREKGGMTYEELKTLLKILLNSNHAVGMEITILDPELDKEGIYTQKFVNELAPLINGKK